MRIRRVIEILGFLGLLMVLTPSSIRASLECHGSGPAFQTNAYCITPENTCQQTRYDTNAACSWIGSNCWRIDRDDSTYCLITDPCSVGIYTKTATSQDCWTCENAVCTGGYSSSQACGSTTVNNSCTTACGNTLSWTTSDTCKECGPYYGAWSSCNVNHKRSRTVTWDCSGDTTQTEDCIGTIKGTLFDASDMTSCPGDIGTNAVYAPLRYGNQTFGLKGAWPIITSPISTNASGNYSLNVYASATLPANYTYDYSDLYAAKRAAGVKLECQSTLATVTNQAQVVTKDTGFWRVYGGWWQVTGGSVYAGKGLQSNIPASVTPATDQRLILPSAGRYGFLAHGLAWAGTELGSNPNAAVSTPLWRVQGTYAGQRFDFNYYQTRMNIFPQ